MNDEYIATIDDIMHRNYNNVEELKLLLNKVASHICEKNKINDIDMTSPRIDIRHFSWMHRNDNGYIDDNRRNLINITDKFLAEPENYHPAKLLFTVLHETRHYMQYLYKDYDLIQNKSLNDNIGYPISGLFYSISPIERDADAFALREMASIIDYLKKTENPLAATLQEQYYHLSNEHDAQIDDTIRLLHELKYLKNSSSKGYHIYSGKDLFLGEEDFSEYKELEPIIQKVLTEEKTIPDIGIDENGNFDDISKGYVYDFTDKKHKIYVQRGESGIYVTAYNTDDKSVISATISKDVCFVHSPYKSPRIIRDKEVGGNISRTSAKNAFRFLLKKLPYIIQTDGRFDYHDMNVFVTSFFTETKRKEAIRIIEGGGLTKETENGVYSGDFKIYDDKYLKKEEDKIIELVKQKRAIKLDDPIINVEPVKSNYAAVKFGNPLDPDCISVDEHEDILMRINGSNMLNETVDYHRGQMEIEDMDINIDNTR